MSGDETERFKTNRVAKLVGLLPFLAGCDEAERTALAHLSVFVVANRGQARSVFDHEPADDADVLARLRTISDFKGGDPGLIARGMALLGLCMVAGYERDRERDGLLGEYNPLSSGAWSRKESEQSLRAAVASRDSVEMDAILPLDQAIVTFWQA